MSKKTSPPKKQPASSSKKPANTKSGWSPTILLGMMLLIGVGSRNNWWLPPSQLSTIRHQVLQQVEPGRKFVFRSAVKVYWWNRKARRVWRSIRDSISQKESVPLRDDFDQSVTSLGEAHPLES